MSRDVQFKDHSLLTLIISCSSALSFWLASGAVDQAQDWSEYYTAAQRSALKASYNAAGISLIVSAFGSTETPVSSGVNPTT